jgi:hypothetical protein
MEITHNRLALVLAGASLLTIYGCGGNSASDEPIPVPVPSSLISGTAATGAPIVGQVIAIDATGQAFSATTSALGAYTVDVAGGTAPFILSVTGMSGGMATTLNSVATKPGLTVNITPLTDLIVATAAGRPAGVGLAALCVSDVAPDQAACHSALTAATSGTRLSDALAAVKKMIAPLDAAGADPLNGAFVANGSGMDAVLDQILVTPAQGLGAMATVALVALPERQLGRVTMPATAGGEAIAATVELSPADILASAAAAIALSEIRVCMASLNALFPATMTAAPTSAAVLPFIDASFSLNGPSAFPVDQPTVVGALSALASNGFGGLARAGLNASVHGFSKFDMSRHTDPSHTFGDAAPVSANVAWVKISAPLAGAPLEHWKMLRGAAYEGCPGGWKVAGQDHIDMHMNARVQKSTLAGVVTYSRGLPFHVNTSFAMAEGIDTFRIEGPGLATYSGNVAKPATLTEFIVMMVAPLPSTPAMVIQGQGSDRFYGNSDQIMSCQDLVGTAAPAGTPCYDETAIAPGAMFKWIAKSAAGTVLYVFPYQLSAVPLSLAFI